MIHRGLLPAAILIAVTACAGGAAGQIPESPGATVAPSPTAATVSALDDQEDTFRPQRENMVTRQIEGRGVEDPRVLDAMRTVPRHRFVPERYRERSYSDTPLPIGEGQTISQPYIVALMSELLQVAPGDRILEVGTGSGYQAAVLAEMRAEVYSVEIIPVLAESARRLLDELGYADVETRIRDGYFGWEEEAPFDGVIVTAAPDHVPSSLLAQLKPDGRLVIPVGPPGQTQTLWLMVQQGGKWVSINQGGVIFVPLVGGP